MWRLNTRCSFRRAFFSVVVVFSSASLPLKFSYRYVHEQPFIDLPPELSQNEAYDVARDALVQLNVMVRRGIEPDALMYTSLIATMGRAKLEWQAYKLFSRMLEHGVRPLPETYVALLDATSTSRQRLRRDLQLKIEESLETFPDELAEEELARQREECRLCVQKFGDFMRGVLPSSPPVSSLQRSVSHPVEEEAENEEKRWQTAAVLAPKADERSGNHTSESRNGEGVKEEANSATCVAGHVREEGSVATMHIRNPTDAWSIARMMEKEQKQRAPQDAASIASLREELNRLHDEELRIFLAAQRQLRHGNKDELVNRVLSNVGEKSIRDMLARRKHYFRSVAHILENDIQTLHRENGDRGDAPRDEQSSLSITDSTLTAAEKETVAPEILYAPWGILRKPNRRHVEEPSGRNMERLERVALSADELQLVRSKGETKDLDELPESLLRRYAYEFNLKWKRRHPLSLLEAVQWHCTTFLPERLDGNVVVRATPALRRQQEQEGFAKTLENYEAFRIIAQRTNNLQVVDHKEINLHLKKIQRDMLQKERRAEEIIRREKNLMDAATLVASAKSFRPPDEATPNVSRVLGVTDTLINSEEINSDNNSVYKNGHNDDYPNCEEIDSNAPVSSLDISSDASQNEDNSELPPWAIFSGSEEFNISTGRFGDPDVGCYQELSDGRFKLLPSQEAREKWVVDRHLLPAPLQDKLRLVELRQQSQHEAVEREYKEKLKYSRYRKWDMFLRKAQAKQKEKKKLTMDGDNGNGGDVVRPLPPKRRFSQLLRKGRDKAPVEDSVKAKYNRSL